MRRTITAADLFELSASSPARPSGKRRSRHGDGAEGRRRRMTILRRDAQFVVAGVMARYCNASPRRRPPHIRRFRRWAFARCGARWSRGDLGAHRGVHALALHAARGEWIVEGPGSLVARSGARERSTGARGMGRAAGSRQDLSDGPLGGELLAGEGPYRDHGDGRRRRRAGACAEAFRRLAEYLAERARNPAGATRSSAIGLATSHSMDTSARRHVRRGRCSTRAQPICCANIGGR